MNLNIHLSPCICTLPQTSLPPYDRNPYNHGPALMSFLILFWIKFWIFFISFWKSIPFSQDFPWLIISLLLFLNSLGSSLFQNPLLPIGKLNAIIWIRHSRKPEAVTWSVHGWEIIVHERTNMNNYSKRDWDSILIKQRKWLKGKVPFVIIKRVNWLRNRLWYFIRN